MSKIGIAIRVTSNGAGEPKVVNGGEWTKYISDVRQVLEKLTGMEDGQQVARMLSFTDDGCIITLMRLLNSGRGGDNVSAWIHIPAEADITGNEVIMVMNSVQKAIQSSELNMKSIEQQCQVNYSKRTAVSMAPTGKGLAVRYYNYVTLMNILGPNRYQPYYNDYRYIFLLDENGQIRISNGANINDISKQPLGKLLSMLPRSAEELNRHFGDDVKVTLSDGTPFDHPIQVEEDERVKLQIERKGFKPVIYFAKQEESVSAPWKLPNPNSIRWMIDVQRSMFSVVDEQGKSLPQTAPVTIKIDGKTLGHKPIEMEEDECRDVHVEVSAGLDYTPSTKSIDLTKGPPVKIQLERKTKEWTSKVKMSNKEIADMTLLAKQFPNPKTCPLQGYEYDEELHCLVYDTLRVWFHRAQGFLAAIVLGLLCWGLTALYGKIHDDKDANGNNQAQIEETVNNNDSLENEQATMIDYQEAINYLENNEQWRKDTLDVINNHALEGLYDDLNTYDFMSIKTNWASKLERSTKFQGILNLIKYCEQNGVTSMNGEYSHDGTITINKYLERINNRVNNSQSSRNAAGSSQPVVTTGQGSSGANSNDGQNINPPVSGGIDDYEGGL